MDHMIGDLIGVLIVVLLLYVISRLILCEIIMWYWKVNHRLDELRKLNHGVHEMNKNLAEIKSILASQASTIAAKPDLLKGLDIPETPPAFNSRQQTRPLREAPRRVKKDDDQLPEL